MDTCFLPPPWLYPVGYPLYPITEDALEPTPGSLSFLSKVNMYLDINQGVPCHPISYIKSEERVFLRPKPVSLPIPFLQGGEAAPVSTPGCRTTPGLVCRGFPLPLSLVGVSGSCLQFGSKRRGSLLFLGVGIIWRWCCFYIPLHWIISLSWAWALFSSRVSLSFYSAF